MNRATGLAFCDQAHEIASGIGKPGELLAIGQRHGTDDLLPAGVADLLRLLGPLTEDEVAARVSAPNGADIGGWLEGLRAADRC